MPNLADLFPPADLQAEIDAGYVTRKQHPELPLSIYTYGRTCQYENHWTPVTIRCRGLVVDDTDGRIVAHCLPKFFNHSQHGIGHDFAPPLPDEPFEIFDKEDGSYGSVFHYDGRWHAASKGSFISEQARWAQAWLNDRPAEQCLLAGNTYLAEILYPENRIVVNNGGEETLVLLAVYDREGTEAPSTWYRADWERLGGRVVRSWPALPVATVVSMAAANTKLDGTPATGTDAEGWVIRFASGVRTKVKLADYVRIHALVTGTNERTIWEALAAGHDPAELFDQVPDEFRDWAVKVADRLRSEVAAWIGAAQSDFDRIGQLPDRKAFAAEAMKSDYRAALFRLYDSRDVSDLAWKAVKPRGDAPFAVDEEG